MKNNLKLAAGNMEQTNNVCLGLCAGANLTTECDVVIVGDNIRSLDRSQKNVLFIGKSVAIGETLFGRPLYLKDSILNGTTVYFPEGVKNYSAKDVKLIIDGKPIAEMTNDSKWNI